MNKFNRLQSISIPLAEKRLATYKACFSAYVQETRQLLPVPKRSNCEW